jgi:RimJ/RimL family protein N-acetyltransferase
MTSAHQRADLGYWLGVPFWGQGYATEAARLVISYGFVRLQLHRIQARCFPRNRASARVLEKVGMRYEGLLRGYLRKGDAFEDALLFAILSTDRSQQAHRSPSAM